MEFKELLVCLVYAMLMGDVDCVFLRRKICTDIERAPYIISAYDVGGSCWSCLFLVGMLVMKWKGSFVIRER